MTKKIMLAILGLSFAFAVTSCGEQGKKKTKTPKVAERQIERHHDRW